ncbi:hypothetical protein HEK616_37290 [Streptomyces nigrescens]|uniref:Transposase n=1 Tax=Streptomyces nigrescens TaxID=1920 RepID=A0ABM7ZV36_STRNI|nr:hypothetical protein HEK616_37290 [Streptomyces nigrescens]
MPLVAARLILLTASQRHRLKKMAYGHKTPYQARIRAHIVLHAARFTCPDLVVTHRPGVREMFAAVRDMVSNGDHEISLRRVE